MPETPLSTALYLHCLGYRVHPLRAKRPFTSEWNTRAWAEDDLRSEFAGADGVGWHLAGYLDFDCDGGDALPALLALGLPETVSWSSARGQHHVYRLTAAQIAEITGRTNRKKFKLGGTSLEVRMGLAPDTHLQSAIPPSGGREWLRSLLDCEPTTLPSIDWLLDALPRRTLPNAPSDGERGTRPGDLFNRDGTWEEILEPLGYVQTGHRSVDGRQVTDWLRPGSDKQLNATTGYCQSTHEDDKLYVFSSSWAPMEQDESYSKFEVWTLTRHGGDYTASSRDLAERGYQTKCDPSVFEDDESPAGTKALSCATPRGATESPDTLTDLLSFPGFVERVAAWHLRRAQLVDRRAGAIAGLMAASWMLGRRVKMYDGTRPNLSALVTGIPGGGKTEIQKSLGFLFEGVGKMKALRHNVASGEGLEDAFQEEPNLLFIRDESQDLLARGDRNTAPHVITLMEGMKRFFSAGDSTVLPRQKANEKVQKPPIIQPSLALLLLGVPQLWSSLPENAYHDGFMARLLALPIKDWMDINEAPEQVDPPDEVLTEMRAWQAGVVFEDSGEGEQKPHLREIPCTDAARRALVDLRREWANEGEGVELYLKRRAAEVVFKLALIAGATGGGEVTAEIVDRARRIVAYSIDTKLTHWQQRGYGDREFMSVIDRVGLYVKQHGRVSTRQLGDDLRLMSGTWARALVELAVMGRVGCNGKMALDRSKFVEVPSEVWISGCGPESSKVE